ncbi:transmembrane protein 107 isoform X4 [Callorhinchus milii]|uniref:transmembrane protein 107 isoform X4 n=1 Tax=Callorhinchus milii TaxID=7868 RepID=UPI0004572D22|nr:transmembrane protein 107 isoform X4 [Callorhinchus milii]|eukprot:gi/632985500/ref/XP_007909716.1/ PREDICTED: transmembrane protein 107 isoform X4 [Callorhinchus milii]
MPLVNSLVPSRFLTILAHLVIVLTILFSRDTNVIASLPPDYEGSQFYSQDAEFIVAITLTLVAFLIDALPALVELVLILTILRLGKKPL